MIGGALYVRVTLQGLARPCISLTSHLATFCTFADAAFYLPSLELHNTICVNLFLTFLIRQTDTRR